jgi:hypothetical protein
MADLTRSNELLASRVSQLASKLESSVDLDVMIKENYQLLDYKLRQGARVGGKLKDDSDSNRPTTGLLPQSGARGAKQGPGKTKGALRYSEQSKAAGGPAGLAPRVAPNILLEERPRTPVLA